MSSLTLQYIYVCMCVYVCICLCVYVCVCMQVHYLSLKCQTYLLFHFSAKKDKRKKKQYWDMCSEKHFIALLNIDKKHINLYKTFFWEQIFNHWKKICTIYFQEFINTKKNILKIISINEIALIHLRTFENPYFFL